MCLEYSMGIHAYINNEVFLQNLSNLNVLQQFSFNFFSVYRTTFKDHDDQQIITLFIDEVLRCNPKFSAVDIRCK